MSPKIDRFCSNLVALLQRLACNFCLQNMNTSYTGWWLSHPSEKYESVGIMIPNIWKNKTCSKPPTSISSYAILYYIVKWVNCLNREVQRGKIPSFLGGNGSARIYWSNPITVYIVFYETERNCRAPQGKDREAEREREQKKMFVVLSLSLINSSVLLT